MPESVTSGMYLNLRNNQLFKEPAGDKVDRRQGFRCQFFLQFVKKAMDLAKSQAD